MTKEIKIVYQDFYSLNGGKHPIPNGLHPEIVSLILQLSSDPYFYIGNVFNLIIQQNSDHSCIEMARMNDFLGYFETFFGSQNIVSTSQILDDDSIYLFPIEINSNLVGLSCSCNLEINQKSFKYFLRDTFSDNTIQLLKTGRIKLLINYINEPVYDDHALRLFESSIRDLGIDDSNIILLSGNNYRDYYKKYPDSKIKILDGILNLQKFSQSLTQYPRIFNGLHSDLIRISDLDIKVIRKKKFLCFNKNANRLHRILLFYFSLKHNFINDSYFSYIWLDPNTNITEILQKYIGSKYQATEYNKLIRDLVPLEFDTYGYISKHDIDTGMMTKEFFIDSYIHIISETVFFEGDSQHPFFSEKTWKPISNLQPFIHVGSANSLKKLKDLGFKTFHPFIDEAYDSEENPHLRINLIEKELKRLSEKSLEEIHNWYYSITDILIHNQNHLYSFKNINPFDEIFQKLKLYF
jgi:hypothetical protein